MSRPDVIIVGAGITGVATALALAEGGARVEVIERYRPAAMASGWTLAGVRQSGRDAAELPLARAAIEIWKTLDERLGVDTGYRQAGNLRLARTEGEAGIIRALVDAQNAAGLAMELLDVEAAREIAPLLSQNIICASWCASDGHADPVASVEGFRAAAERLGVRFRTGVAASEIVTGYRGGGRRFVSLKTTQGEVPAGACLLASGVQTNTLHEGLGLNVPMSTPLVAVLQTVPVPASLAPVIGVANADLAIRQQVDGCFRFTGGAQQSGSSLEECDGQPVVRPSAGSLARAITLVSDVLPMIATTPVARVWGGLLDLTPDALPVLDRTPGIEGLFVAAGFSGHGFGIGPAVGEALAGLILGQPADIPLDAFRFERFGDGCQTGEAAPLSLHG